MKHKITVGLLLFALFITTNLLSFLYGTFREITSHEQRQSWIDDMIDHAESGRVFQYRGKSLYVKENGK